MKSLSCVKIVCLSICWGNLALVCAWAVPTNTGKTCRTPQKFLAGKRENYICRSKSNTLLQTRQKWKHANICRPALQEDGNTSWNLGSAKESRLDCTLRFSWNGQRFIAIDSFAFGAIFRAIFFYVWKKSNVAPFCWAMRTIFRLCFWLAKEI